MDQFFGPVGSWTFNLIPWTLMLAPLVLLVLVCVFPPTK